MLSCHRQFDLFGFSVSQSIYIGKLILFIFVVWLDLSSICTIQLQLTVRLASAMMMHLTFQFLASN